MTHIHLVEPYHSVAMTYHVQPLQEHLPKLYEVTTGDDIDTGADVNIHIPWHTLAGQERGNCKHIAIFTHLNPGNGKALLDACSKADIVTAMSFDGRRELISYGIDPAKIWVIPNAANQYQYRPRLIGIVGYPQPNGRKREHLLLDMAWQYDLSMYEFLFVGDGWEPFAKQLASLGVKVLGFHADGFEAINEIYARIDALLVTGYAEGGPLPVLEAMATGCKIFSPRFGYAADLLSDDELYNDLPDLMCKLEKHFRQSMTNRLLANAWTWQDYVIEYGLLIGRLLGESVDLLPEFGMSRYAQLLDVIDDCRPAKLVEIGTWNGHTAQRMIQQAAKYRPIERVSYQGFDLFGMQTAEDFRNELSKMGYPKAIVEKRLKATGANIELIEGYTRDTLHNMHPADLYFIDGGHCEETIAHDAESVFLRLQGKAVVIFDDYYTPPIKGYGCNRLIDNLDRNTFEVIHLPARTQSDRREIGMVKVRRNNADIRLQMPQTTHTGSYTDYRASVSGLSSWLRLPALSSHHAPRSANGRSQLERLAASPGRDALASSAAVYRQCARETGALFRQRKEYQKWLRM